MAVDTFFVGALKGVGKLHLQSSIDCRTRCAWARLYPSKLPVTAVRLMNNDVLPIFEAHAAKIEVVLSDNGRSGSCSTSACASRGGVPGSRP